MKDIEPIIEKAKENNPKIDSKVIKEAYQFAQKAHHGQMRISGEPVANHFLGVADVLADWKLGTTSIVAGLLHDVVEDTEITLAKLEKTFGKEVASLVDGVTKVGEIKLQTSAEEKFTENLRKMLLVMAKDLRVVLIKLADRHHNMQTLQVLPRNKQIRIARETLEVYAPLAERLGIGEMKGKLEDLAFPYVYPKECQWLKKISKSHYRQAEIEIQGLVKELRKELKAENINGQVNSRTKHFYSLWKKLLRPEVGKDIEEIYDLMAMRIITNSTHDCYAALGVVHKLWKPVPLKGISDFIAQPKPNGYRSIHTNVFGPKGKILEIQIRTDEMHDQAENGIAAHWHYSQAKSKVSQKTRDEIGTFVPSEKLAWVKQLVNWQKEIVDSQEFMTALKFDALAHRNFIFSPKGDVYDLPTEATPVDFAYAVHTDLGDRTSGAKVNGKMVKLNHKLKSGDIVEIIKSKQAKPSQDWLDFVVTTVARRRIGRREKG